MPKKGNFKQKKKLRSRGRNVDPAVKDSLIQLLDIQYFRRDHLIEYLHVIQDRIGYIDENYMTALADLLDISQTEVYEVASFYHHFDVITNGASKPQSLTVRVCYSVTCKLNGADELIENLENYYK